MPHTALRKRLVSDRNSEARIDELFRQAVGTFAALSRPSGHEIRQLETLALALYERTGTEARRYAAAVLSERSRVPRGLLLKLALEPVSISAPLLSRTHALSTRDWLHIIKQTDIEHGRVIARRSDLPTAVRAILTHLQRKQGVSSAEQTSPKSPESLTPSHIEKGSAPPTSLKEVQLQLRAAMAGNDVGQSATAAITRKKPSTRLARLRASALSGDIELFGTALADALGIKYAVAHDIIHSKGTQDLVMALRALSIPSAEAHLIVRAARPDTLSTTASIRLFIERFDALSAVQADDRLRDWRVQSSWISTYSSTPENPIKSSTDDAWDMRKAIDFDELEGGNDAYPSLRAVG
ncbi:hypothetical protein [Notoacmeibacter sp. MSK16QG-6]|uniref:hypothetical protein n=1 Tax=Notoacmeibacter sp. MSK16QG-6 TaxID=2957982 RepID=UPI00209FF7D3|nr:hypothetical protein [Notoacmeibacter sp. MSK16QG-6]MCP1198145.1 hypothetical protein [Notoacmeibacter sp. MSK16QG-6]